MFKLKKHPYNLLLLAAILFFIASIFMSNQALDMHLYDTYFILSLFHFIWSIIILLLLFWTFNLLTSHILFSKVLTWLHIVLIVLASISLVAILFYSNYQGIAGTPRAYYDFSSWETIVQSGSLTKGIALIILIIISGVFIYILNLTMGVIKRFTRRRKQ